MLAAKSIRRIPGSRRPVRQAAPGLSSDAVACARLRALIVSGQLAPGAPLIESDLSVRLGVSRTPVRAAILRLHQEGFIRFVAAGAGARRAMVSPLTADDLREVFLMVGALESTAVRQAALLDHGMREALCATLTTATDALSEAVHHRPPLLVAAQDQHLRFHRLVVDAAGGPRLRAELEVLSPQAERYQRVYAAATLYAVDEFVAGHRAIIAAIHAGDADAAEQAASADWRITAERHCELVTVLGERGSW